MIDHEETFCGLKRWLERSEWTCDAIDRRTDRNPAFDPNYACTVWAADRDLLIEILANTPARTMAALRVKVRALLTPCGAPTDGLLGSIVRDLLAMLTPATAAW